MDEKNLTEDTPANVSRRNFIKGVVAAGATVSSASYLFRTTMVSGQQASAAGSVERLITLNINGQNRRVDVMKQETLAHDAALQAGADRHQARLRPRGMRRVHGAHRRCAALFVLDPDALGARQEGHDDRRPRGADGTLHPVQRGVVEEQGFQCAFCMPGFVMATVGYLKTNPNPTRQELAHGVSGNLCRCQDYDKILTALIRGAELLRRA